MTQTLEPATRTSAARRRVETWLSDFAAALAARDADRAAGLFATTSFWRDLIAFTWNITTVEGREGVADLLRHTMETHRRHRLPDHRGRGARRGRRRRHGVDQLRDRRRPRLGPAAPERRGRLDAADHARRAQGPRGAPGRRPGPRACSTAPTRTGSRGRRRAPPRSRASAATATPTSLVIGGGQGGIALGRAAAPARHRPPRRRPARAARRPVAQPLQVALPARPRLVRPPALPAVPAATGRSSRRRTRSATGSRCTRGSWRSTTGAPRPRRTPPGTTRRRSGRSPSTATARRSCCTPSSSSSRSGCRASRTSRRSPARTSSAASSTTAPSTRARTTTRTSGSSSSARTTRRSTSAGRCGRSAPT